jgi:hypothetical protein
MLLTVKALINREEILRKAFAHPDMMRIRSARPNEWNLAWLRQNLIVEMTPGIDLVYVGFRQGTTGERAEVINLIVDALTQHIRDSKQDLIAVADAVRSYLVEVHSKIRQSERELSELRMEQKGAEESRSRTALRRRLLEDDLERFKRLSQAVQDKLDSVRLQIHGFEVAERARVAM